MLELNGSDEYTNLSDETVSHVLKLEWDPKRNETTLHVDGTFSERKRGYCVVACNAEGYPVLISVTTERTCRIPDWNK